MGANSLLGDSLPSGSPELLGELSMKSTLKDDSLFDLSGTMSTTSASRASAAKQRVRDFLEQAFREQDGVIHAGQLRSLLQRLVPGADIDALLLAAGRRGEDLDTGITCATLVDWIFAEPSTPFAASSSDSAPVATPPAALARGWGQTPRKIAAGSERGRLGDVLAFASFQCRLQQILEEHPYLEPINSVRPHPLYYWVDRCRQCIAAEKFGEGQEHLMRLVNGLETDKRQVAEAFRRFDTDGSGQLDAQECKHMSAYLGWGDEEAALLDIDGDGVVTLSEFQHFVGRHGGVSGLFEHRRLRISHQRKDVCDYAGIAVGARVRAHFYVRGHKSRSWREAQVLAVGIERQGRTGVGPPSYGVLLEFGFGTSQKLWRWRARQVVPPTWVVSSVSDASVVDALREIGLLDDQQSFWALLLPDSEMQAVERLEPCQRKALAGVRAHASISHEESLLKVRERFQRLGYVGRELQAVLGWIQDLAPICVHVNLDRMGHFLESDEFYRNQFETKTSGGAYDSENLTRKRWETDLFGGAYDEASPFERCKYGAMCVMNDYRGVVRARQYGDSYLVLKDVRLRLTFASTDSGGMQGKRLAVLDKYAHVLSEYNDGELNNLVRVAMAATCPGTRPTVEPTFLRGSTEDSTMEWITAGFPTAAQQSGRFFFEVTLEAGTASAQVGLLSSLFEARKGIKTSEGVGDDVHGWAVDGQHSARWHNGLHLAWGGHWPASGTPTNRVLSREVVVGIAVDLDQRWIRFSTDGGWEDVPAFGSDDIPGGLSLYPAISLKGRATFNFGPNFRHAPPPGDAYSAWPALSGLADVHDNRLGNEEQCSMYKEVQIHGEVNLGKHVQRLVACNKYREASKTQRNYAVRVSNCGAFDGAYRRAGARNGLPIYRSDAGSIIYYDSSAELWRMNLSDDFDGWLYYAPMAPGSGEPPRTGWRARDADRGFLPAEDFFAALRALKPAVALPEEVCGRMSAKLSGEDAEGRPSIFRVRGDNSLAKEWASLENGPCSADEFWEAATQEALRRLAKEAGINGRATVVQSKHPYDAKRHSWREEVLAEGYDRLRVHFYSRSCTLDSSTVLRIYTGGLRRCAAGPGARVEVPLQGGDKIWGTVVEGGLSKMWRIKLDRREPTRPKLSAADTSWPSAGDRVEARQSSGGWHRATVVEVREGDVFIVDWFDGVDEDREKRREELRELSRKAKEESRCLEDLECYVDALEEGACFAVCHENPQRVRVEYTAAFKTADEQGFSHEAVVGDEIASFALDSHCPLSPLSVKGFVGSGPAQAKGVEMGWYLDLAASLAALPHEVAVELVRGQDAEDAEIGTLVKEAMRDPKAILPRLNTCLLRQSRASLVFTNSSSSSRALLLPMAHVTYASDGKASEEIRDFVASSDGEIRIASFVKHGPAHAAGVRSDWLLDVRATLRLNPSFLRSAATKLPCGALAKLPSVSIMPTSPKGKKPEPVASETPAMAEGSRVRVTGDDCETYFGCEGKVVEFDEDDDPVIEFEDGAREAFYRHDVTVLPIPVAKPTETAAGDAETGEETGTSGEDAAGAGAEKTSDADVLAVPRMLLDCSGATLVFVQPQTEKTKRFEFSGASGEEWVKDVVIQGDFADFEFSTNGDGASERDKRWGVMALVVHENSAGTAEDAAVGGELTLAQQEAFCQRFFEIGSRANGLRETPTLERDCWDEARLRALCAIHGWEFEWMTEDGERQRRKRERWDLSGLIDARSSKPTSGDAATPDGVSGIGS